jgi:hypothetical protein
MKLHEVPRKSLIRVRDDSIRVPPGGKVIENGHILKFDHIDGMYSYCVDSKGDVVHLAAWTEVDILPNGMLD